MHYLFFLIFFIFLIFFDYILIFRLKLLLFVCDIFLCAHAAEIVIHFILRRFRPLCQCLNEIVAYLGVGGRLDLFIAACQLTVAFLEVQIQIGQLDAQAFNLGR